MFFDKVSISRLSRLQKVRIRMREADAAKITENRWLQANFAACMLGVHEAKFSRNHASASSKLHFSGPAGSSRTRTSAFAPRKNDLHMARKDGESEAPSYSNTL